MIPVLLLMFGSLTSNYSYFYNNQYNFFERKFKYGKTNKRSAVHFVYKYMYKVFITRKEILINE